jgi:hypothetical protein
MEGIEIQANGETGRRKTGRKGRAFLYLLMGACVDLIDRGTSDAEGRNENERYR